MTTDLTTLERGLLADIDKAVSLDAIEQVRIAALGKKGCISELMQTLGKLPPEERKAFGQSVNALKARVSEALEQRKGTLEEAALEQRLANERADVTLPVRPGPETEGRIHPVSQVMDELAEIFADMGFAIAEGPDIETDDNNFTKLNIPHDDEAETAHPHHRARPRLPL
jgi:phenylalanyl-tRNA synthetase alpha chain